mmetsp:Transcript_3822/g.4571  ORF Transcript_3822/g.4571 Transcript_3822/m.4571 type:complete len:90 (-) Transcript_3822:211-480(-)
MEHPVAEDLENSQFPGQTGSAVLDLKGQIVRGGSGQLTADNAAVLYRMLVEVGMLEDSSFRRMTVKFPSVRFVVARDEHYVYIVQGRTS